MPLTPGLLWTPSGSTFQKSVMTHGCSLAQLQWIYYLQETEFCIDQEGNRIQIEHAYHRGEVKRGPYKIDGYLRKDNQDYFLEFLGKFSLFDELIDFDRMLSSSGLLYSK